MIKLGFWESEIIQALNIITGVTIRGRQEKVNEGDDITKAEIRVIWPGTKEWQKVEETRKRFSYGASRTELNDAFISHLSLILDFKPPEC